MYAMYAMVQWVKARLESDERGAAAVEYGLLVALIAAAVVVTVSLLGGKLDAAFTKVYDNIKDAV
jgi:pilus assembly protein Flp/PilA